MPTTVCLQTNRDQVILLCFAAAFEILKINNMTPSALSRLKKLNSFSVLKNADRDHHYSHISWSPVLKEETKDTALPTGA